MIDAFKLPNKFESSVKTTLPDTSKSPFRVPLITASFAIKFPLIIESLAVLIVSVDIIFPLIFPYTIKFAETLISPLISMLGYYMMIIPNFKM